MKMRMTIMSAALLATAGAASAQTAPRLPNDYDILTRVSIFSRDRQVRQFSNNNQSRNRYNNTRRTPQRNYTPILVGAMVEDDGYFVAFIADPGTGFMTSYRVGDVLPVNAGTIKDISLDDITTVAADHTTKKINIGETITGGAAEYPSADAPASSTDVPATAPAAGENGPGGDNGGPSGDDNGPPPGAASVTAAPSAGPPAAGATSGGVERLPGETMLDYLRRRRAQQLKK